jgi:ribosomal protein S4
MRKIYKFKLIKRLGFDPLFFFSRQAIYKKKKQIPFFGYKFLFRRIFALPGHKRRLFFSMFRNFGRFRPRFLHYRRLNRRGPKTKFLRVLFSIQALRNFYYFKRLKVLKRFFRFSKFRKQSLRGYSIFSHKARSIFKKLFVRLDASTSLSSQFSSVIVKRKEFLSKRKMKRVLKKNFRSYFVRSSVWGRKVHFLEFRLFSILLRSGFYLTPNSLLRSIKDGQKIFVNGKPISSPNILLSRGDCVTFSNFEAVEVKCRLARLLRGIFSPRYYKPNRKFDDIAASRSMGARKKYFFFDRFYHCRYCRRFPLYTLPLSSRHFVVSYSFPMIFVVSDVLNSLSLSYPFSKTVAKPSSYFFTK